MQQRQIYILRTNQQVVVDLLQRHTNLLVDITDARKDQLQINNNLIEATSNISKTQNLLLDHAQSELFLDTRRD